MALTSREKQAAFRARRKAAVVEAAELRIEVTDLRDEVATLRVQNALLRRAAAERAAPPRVAPAAAPAIPPRSGIRVRI